VRRSFLSVNELARSNIGDKDPRQSAGGFVQIRAFAKINLILEVLGKRSDGYHELKSVMQTLALHDTVVISTAAQAEGNFQLTSSDPGLPTDNRNLITRAARYMMQEYGITQPVSIQLEKRIPVAAGLAGGSSDCAATLLGFNILFGLDIPMHSTKQTSLMEIGRYFGADVPFCIMGNATLDCVTALAEGIGERLTPLAPHPHVWVVLACPDIPVSTADIFDRYNNLDLKLTKNKKNKTNTTNLSAVLQALTQGDLQAIASNFKNDLTQVTTKLHPEIQHVISKMHSLGALGVAMSGSGPSVFGYFSNKEDAVMAQEKLQQIVGRVFLTHI